MSGAGAGVPLPGCVPPHPAEVATRGTPVAHDAADVTRLAAGAADLAQVEALSSVCRACPRLVTWREAVAAAPRASYAGERYWGRPVPSWGDLQPRVLIVGLAPAAHGGNRTGRIFTGDRSGDFLFAGLHRAGLAAIPTSTHAGDGQRLLGCRIVAAVRCAPPANRPEPGERDACRPWLVRELELARGHARATVVLGGYAWEALWPALTASGYAPPRPRPRFAHGAEVTVGAGMTLLGCYHPSQQNTFTGRMTPAMLDGVLAHARALAG